MLARERWGQVAERKKEDQKKDKRPLHGAKIEDYCVIGDCETAALVSRDGSIDWLCWPTFSSGACFAALLGTEDHGFWKIAPAGKIKNIQRQYKPHTLVIETTYEGSCVECAARFRCGWISQSVSITDGRLRG